jgi:hypothetical protein
MDVCQCGRRACSGHDGRYAFVSIPNLTSEVLTEARENWKYPIHSLFYTNAEMNRIASAMSKQSDFHSRRNQGKRAEQQFCDDHPGFEDNTGLDVKLVDVRHKLSRKTVEIKADNVPMRSYLDAQGHKLTTTIEMLQDKTPGRMRAGGPFKAFHSGATFYVKRIQENDKTVRYVYFRCADLAKKLIYLLSINETYGETRSTARHRVLYRFSLADLQDVMLTKDVFLREAA